MTVIANQILLHKLRAAARAKKIDDESFIEKAEQLIVFGSRAAGVNSDHSDIDVLCVTNRRVSIKTSELDCICKTPKEVTEPDWLQSELATHIARYGIWLFGTDNWTDRAQINWKTIAGKERRVRSLIQNMQRSWPQFHSLFRAKYSTTLRRELQRLKLLRNLVPVAPTPVLDSSWITNLEDPAQLAATVRDDSGFVAKAMVATRPLEIGGQSLTTQHARVF